MPKIDVSFKQTSKDMKLYAAVMAEEEKSDFIKKAIELYIKYLNGGGYYAKSE
ncbi:hypothetical protein LGL08_20245 [Clostridium estertheticum]|uniref:hypothetical protein n=1 Tax=Clostridium estertheticum TaxID=238834 RepID=UPI001CF338A0|nr:hypothetical protein [Clostridium estertheticum]MCB2309037.1 hypothetical protein [Clostridium estertheticum]MCB2346829.1 hypothetical protein [Clostridium estertheticum]MCB2351859.1 hypothetical protein [Clostridium estertheticum]WAG48387.1 hypothetical protein LL127_23050 [Clostridium estertheticum]